MNDAETPPSNLTVTATSSNTAVVANSDISIGGIGASRTVSVLPTAVGLSNIVVSVSDGTVYTTFTINYAVLAESTFPGIDALPRRRFVGRLDGQPQGGQDVSFLNRPVFD